MNMSSFGFTYKAVINRKGITLSIIPLSIKWNLIGVGPWNSGQNCTMLPGGSRCDVELGGGQGLACGGVWRW